jgi:MFS family permease
MMIGNRDLEPNRDGTAAWAPLAHPVYRAFFFAQLASNTGLFMQNVGAVWLMGSLGGTAVMIALVQTAQSLPMFLFGMPAGALADLVDRRRLLFVAQSIMLVAAGVLALLTWTGNTTPLLLLVATFALGSGNALNIPAWQASQPELVPRREFPQAIALGTATGNFGLAVGPAIGGLIVALSGPGTVFLINCVLFVPMAIAITRWRREPHVSQLPAERLAAAIRAGVRYARHSSMLLRIFARVVAITVPIAVITALLPVVARHELGMDSTGYGLLLACFGGGGVLSTFVTPWLRAHLSVDGRLALACVLSALTATALATVTFVPVLGLVLLTGGAGWQLTWATFQVATQRSLPAWVRARGMSLYFLVWAGSYAVGGAMWGEVADLFDARLALLSAAVLLVASMALALRWPLALTESFDHDMVTDLPSPPTLMLEPGAGPILVTREYIVRPGRRSEFIDAMHAIRTMRQQLGAFAWGLYDDPSAADRIIETYQTETWSDHLRQSARMTVNARRIEHMVADMTVPNSDDPRFYVDALSTRTRVSVGRRRNTRKRMDDPPPLSDANQIT